MTTLWNDIRYGLRMLAKNPGFSVLVILILAIGIGATTATLSVSDAVLLRPPPYEDPDSLVYLYTTHRGDDSLSRNTSYANIMDWRDQSTVFEQVVGECNWGPINASVGTRRERIWGRQISPEFFSILRVKPELGRLFLPEDDRPGSARVVIISHSIWWDWFDGEPDMIGRTLVLDREAYTVIGVLPADFRHISAAEHFLWLPLSYVGTEAMASRSHICMSAMARLKPGVSVAQAQEQMNVIARRLEQAYPASNSGKGISVVSLSEICRQETVQHRRAFFAAQGIASSVLLVACLHVASLLLIRSARREREIAIRIALGAERLHLIRQLLTESFVLAGLGSLFGLLLASWSISAVSALRAGPASWYVPSQVRKLIPWFVELRIDGRTLVYALSVSVSTYLLFASLPAFRASKARLGASLSLGRAPSRGRGLCRVRSVLVTTDVAFAFVLLIGAGLMINSYVRILHIDPGYNAENVLCACIILDETEPSYSQPQGRLQFFQDVLDRVKRMPQVTSVTAASATPVTGTGNFSPIKIEDLSPGDYGARFTGWEKYLPDRDYFFVRHRQVFAGHFRVFEIPVLRGRDFTERDTQASSPVAIINESMARHFWTDENPVGKYLVESDTVQRQIIGVVGDEKHFRTDARSGEPEVYIPYRQSGCTGTMCVMARTGSDPGNVAAVLRNAISAVDPSVFIHSITVMEDYMTGYFSPRRFAMFSLSICAIVTLLLASVGVYGVTAYSVAQRTQEIGIRMALGAQISDVLKSVLQHGFKLTLIGLTIGLMGAFAATRIIRSLLYDVSPTDTLTFVCMSLLLIGVTLLASYIPARRAAKIDPMEALRYE